VKPVVWWVALASRGGTSLHANVVSPFKRCGGAKLAVSPSGHVLYDRVDLIGLRSAKLTFSLPANREQVTRRWR